MQRFEEYVFSQQRISGVISCVQCSGSGKIYDPNDPPCSVEGHKGRNKIQCPKCDGAKTGKMIDYVDGYVNYVKNKVTSQLQRDNEQVIMDKIKSVLTGDELKAFYKMTNRLDPSSHIQ